MTNAGTLDQGAEHVLRRARQIAEERGEPMIAPHVLLVALTEVATPPVREVLTSLGLGLFEVRTWLDTAIGPVGTPMPFDDASPYAARTVAILDMAGAEAVEAGSAEIRSRDILFGILREKHAATGVTGAALVARGATYDTLRAALG